MLVHNAIIFASKKHKGQYRKGTEIPYIVHPMEVMQILTEMNCDENVIIAGILHDTLEDTDTTPEEIKNIFGSDILNIVFSESEDKSKTWKERKQHTIDMLSNESIEIQLVCFADKMSNLKSMCQDKLDIGEELWKRFNSSKENIKWYYQNIYDVLKIPLKEKYSEYLHEYETLMKLTFE